MARTRLGPAIGRGDALGEKRRARGAVGGHRGHEAAADRGASLGGRRTVQVREVVEPATQLPLP